MTGHLKSANSLGDFLTNQYNVSKWETFERGDQRFKPGTTYPLLGTSRNYFLCSLLSQKLSEGARVVDMGVFPGTQARLLKQLLPFDISITGVGLCLDSDFKQFIDPFVDPIYTLDLDPFYAGHDKEIRIPIEDNSLDAAYAMEIIEHLITPLPMLSELSRILKPGGILIMSTPNISHFGSLMYLLRGKSNNVALDHSPMCMPDSEWRGHVRLYAKDELISLGSRYGLSCVAHHYYLEKGNSLRRWQGFSLPYYLLRRLMGCLVPFWREDQIIVLQKS